jgi:acetyltransferase-like isoleucine patch superfamily enzyme
LVGKITIGKNSVIGCGSVVMCDVPANEVWAGNPAKFIKKLSIKDAENEN